MDRQDRVAVAKLAAILRLAIALDESRSQRISSIKCRLENNRLIIVATGVDDVSLEQLALRQTGNLFEEIFGFPVQIRSAAQMPMRLASAPFYRSR